jgi:2'-5' RNA ligase
MSSQLIRCFIAIKIPSDITIEISNYIETLKKITPAVRWAKADNLHLTLRFLGEIETERVEKVRSALSDMENKNETFRIKIDNSGCFPGRKRPRVFWLGVDSGAASNLRKIHKDLQEVLKYIGFDPDLRKFSPHLTIGRVKRTEDFSGLYTYLDNHGFTSKDFKAERLYLIRSFLKPGGAEYKDLASYRI